MSRLAVALRALWRSTYTALAPLLGRRGPTFPVVLAPSAPPHFPDPTTERGSGMIAIGGDLSVERLLNAYRQGIFPWYGEDTPILWWSPDPRAIFEMDGFHVSRRLARTVRGGKFSVTFNQAFDRVIRGCRIRAEGTWITDEMLRAYDQLHRLGHAHSVEVWHDGELAGGTYGVSVGGLFAGESMFTRVRDASKVALVHLVGRLRERGYTLFDIQYLNDHTYSLGGVEVSRREYLRRLRLALIQNVSFG